MLAKKDPFRPQTFADKHKKVGVFWAVITNLLMYLQKLSILSFPFPFFYDFNGSGYIKLSIFKIT